MCLLLYIASDHPLPLKPWNKKKPDFHISELSKELKVAVKKHFDFSHVRSIGTYEGCGCAFNYEREYSSEEDEVEQLAIAQKSRQKLIEYIKMNHVKQIYSCWANEEEVPTKSRKTIYLNRLLNDDFLFQEHELLTIIL